MKPKRGDKVTVKKSFLGLQEGLQGRIVQIEGTNILVAFSMTPMLHSISLEDQQTHLKIESI